MAAGKTISIFVGSSRKISRGKDISNWVQFLINENFNTNKNFQINEFTPTYPINVLSEPINSIPPLAINTIKNPSDIEKYESDLIKDFSTKISNSNAFIFILPVYNHSYPGSFKIMIDHLFHEFSNKPVYIISYGHSSPSLCTIDTIKLLNKLKMNIITTSDIKLNKDNNYNFDTLDVKNEVINNLSLLFDSIN